MCFDIKMNYKEEPLGLAFEGLADHTVRIKDVTSTSPCGRAGVVCGIIASLDCQPVKCGDDLRRIVGAIRESGRTDFSLEIIKKPKQDATFAPAQDAAVVPAPVPNIPGQNMPQASHKSSKQRQKNQKAKEQRNDALVRLFVLFKYGRRAEYASNQRVPLGAHVLVESREGVDLGLVAGARLGGRKDDKYRVQRIATEAEVGIWRKAVADENAALAIAHRIAAGNPNMEIHRCEYQFDRKKVTFHFSGKVSRAQQQTFIQQASSFGCKVALNNCQPPAGERGDPIDLSAPAIPVL